MRKLSTRMKTLLTLALIYVLVFCGFICFFFLGYMDIPLGWLLGGVFGFALCFLHTLSMNENSKMATMVILIFARIIIIAVPLLLSGILYKYAINVFNIFSTAGALLLAIIVLVIVTLINRPKKVEPVKEEIKEQEDGRD